MLAAFVIGWEVFWRMMGIRPMGPMRLKRMLQKPTGSEPFLVDVRTAAEFRLFHIRGAESRPGLLLDPNALAMQDRQRPLVVVCLSGHRSPIVGARLKKLGFKDVYYLSWGMLAWIVFGGKVER
jgi:rhodanese-related sulfurtransferase